MFKVLSAATATIWVIVAGLNVFSSELPASFTTPLNTLTVVLFVLFPVWAVAYKKETDRHTSALS